MGSKRFLYCFVPTLALGLAGCSGSSGSSSGSALNVSGMLSLGNSSQSLSVQSAGISDDDISAMSVNITNYKVSCATQSTPVRSGTASISSDGSFTVSIEGATGQPLSCVLIDANGDKAADFLISDSSKKDLNGNSQSTSTAAFKQNANLGTINFDPNAGEVTVPATNIASAVAPVTASASEVFDPTGAWTISSVDFTLPKGTKAPCANHNNCDGPPEGQAIYLKLWKGLQTSDSSDVYGLQVWQGQNSFSTCGSKIGLTPGMETALGVDFSANGSADDVFTFASSVSNFTDQITSQTSTVTLTNGWQMSTAKLQYDLNPNCGPHDISVGGVTYTNAWVCGPDNSSYYQANLGGGCTDSSGNPVMLRDWSTITNNQCQSSIDGNGIRTNTCSGGASINNQSVSVTCTNKWAVATLSSGVYTVNTSNSVNFNWNDLSAAQIPSGTLCSDTSKFTGATEALKIAQLQCYSQYYYQSGMESANACLPRVDMDWSASTAANFAIVDKIRPQGLVFFEKYTPFADGSGGSLLTRQEHYSGVNVDGNNWVNCRVIEVGGLNIKKISATKLLATYQSSLITTSTSKPACLATFTGARETYMFYLSK